jgi:hypothetical protein
MADPAGTVSKGEYAGLKGVTAGRVSQWIREGKIDGGALVGHGRFARIHVETANQQLLDRLDGAQMLGNGLGTDLIAGDADDLAPDAPRLAIGRTRDPVSDAIAKARLEKLQRDNRQAQREELAARGIYTPTVDAQAAMTAGFASMLNVFEGSLADFASALAAKFGIPQRDVLHLLKAEFRQVRARAAAAARKRAAQLDEIVAHDPETEAAEAA